MQQRSTGPSGPGWDIGEVFTEAGESLGEKEYRLENYQHASQVGTTKDERGTYVVPGNRYITGIVKGLEAYFGQNLILQLPGERKLRFWVDINGNIISSGLLQDTTK